MWGCGWGYMGWWGPFFGLLWFVLLGLFLYWLVRTLAPERRDRALEVLRERYARGEIDKDWTYAVLKIPDKMGLR
jgi:putative membrane protein